MFKLIKCLEELPWDFKRNKKLTKEFMEFFVKNTQQLSYDFFERIPGEILYPVGKKIPQITEA